MRINREAIIAWNAANERAKDAYDRQMTGGLCRASGCARGAMTRGLCKSHYERERYIQRTQTYVGSQVW